MFTVHPQPRRNIMLKATATVSFCAAVATSVSAANITAYYDFEGIGSDIYDDPAGAFADDLTGQAGKATSSDTPGAFAGTQSALFDGDTTKLWTSAYTTDLTGSNTYTVMFWIKAADIDQENTSIRLMNVRTKADNTNATAPAWSVEGFGNPATGSSGDSMDLRKFSTVLGGGGFTPDATNALARADQAETAVWRHVAFVVSNSGHNGNTGNDAFARTYVDGTQVGFFELNDDQNGVSIANTDGVLIIGGGEGLGGGSRDFTGLLDDIALFDGEVSAQDIADIANGDLSPASFIPEPSSLALLGLGGLFVARRRRG